MITASDFKNGLTIELEGKLFTVLWFQHHKPGKGGAIMRTKLKNVKTGQVIEKTFRGGEKFEETRIERKKSQYLYQDKDQYVFMDLTTYDQLPLHKELLQDKISFLMPEIEVDMLWHKDKLIGVELPITVVLEVTSTVPGLKGDTVTGATKPATLETGIEIQVPLFVNVGERLVVDTRTGKYVERA